MIIPSSYLNFSIFMRNLQNPNIHGGFTPATLAPPITITRDKVVTALSALRRGGPGGQALCPLQSIGPFIQCDDKRNSPEPGLLFLKKQESGK
jgi:hypothetical protein